MPDSQGTRAGALIRAALPPPTSPAIVSKSPAPPAGRDPANTEPAKETVAVIDLYYWPTPNGHKLTIFCEEAGIPYKINPANIQAGG